MKEEAFVRAYDSVAPDPGVQERIMDSIRARAKPRRRPVSLRRVVVILAAVICLMAALAVGGYAAWEWMLPEPSYYDGSRGDVIVRSEQYFDSLPAVDPAELTDEAFLLRARELLAAVGMPQSEDSEAYVIRQENLEFARNEVVVRFGPDTRSASVEYLADTGSVLRLSSHSDEWEREDLPVQQIDVDALAQKYAALLTGRSGYTEIRERNSSDDLVTVHVYATVLDGVVNPCDSMMLVISRRTSALLLAGVFYTPLIDDADTGVPPITAEEAREIVESGVADLSGAEEHMGAFESFRFSGAELSVVRPDWSFTGMVDRENGSVQIPDFARLAWVVTYTRDGKYHEDEYCYEFWIDYYTGQLLGGEAMQAV